MIRTPKLISSGAMMAFAFSCLLPSVASAEVDKKILRAWKAKCSSCHGDDGKGTTEQGKKMSVRDMSSPEFWKDLTDAKMKDAIANGIKQTKNGVTQEMEPYKDKLKPEDIDGLVAYIKTFKK